MSKKGKAFIILACLSITLSCVSCGNSSQMNVNETIDGTMSSSSSKTNDETDQEITEGQDSQEDDGENEEVSVTVTTSDEATEVYEIETPYCTLMYPDKWENKVRTEVGVEDICEVKFYCAIEGKPEIELFDVIFGGEEGYKIGELYNDNGTISVYVITYDLELDDSWSENEQLEILGMQEDINTIISNLNELNSFIPT